MRKMSNGILSKTGFSTISLFLFLLLILPFVSATTDLNQFIHQWNLENVTDTNSTWNFTNTNGVTFNNGKYSLGANFTNSNTNKILTTNNALTASEGQGNWTINFWMWQQSYVNDTRVFEMVTGTTGYNFWFHAQSSACSGKPAFAWYDGASTTRCFTNGITKSAWNMITLVHNGTDNGLRVYVNGVLDSNLSVSFSTTSRCGSVFAIGNENYCGSIPGGTYFSGMVDAFVIYKTTLTPSEIGNLTASQYPYDNGYSVSNNVTITVNDFYTNSNLANFSAIAYNSSGYQYNGSTTTGTLDNWSGVSFLQNSTQVWTINISSTENGGYFNRTLTSQNVSTNLNISLAQSVINFITTRRISDETISGVNYTTTYLTNTTHYMRAGTYNVTASKSGEFNVTQSITVTPYQSSTVTIENMTNSYLNLTVINIVNGSAILNYTAQLNISAYNYSENISTTNGSIVFGAINGTWDILIDAPGFAYFSNSTTLVSGVNNVTLYIYTSESVNVTFRDEITNAVINTTTIYLEMISSVASYNYSTTNGYKYFDLVTPTAYTLRYSASGYTERFGYLEISERSSQNITLYLLPANTTTNITLTVINENAQNVEGALVRILKYDIVSNTYVERESQFTDYAGQIRFGAELSSEFYQFLVEYPIGTVALTTSPAYLISSTLTLQINTRQTETSIDKYLGVTSTLEFNTGTNNYRSTFSNSQNLLDNVCMYVYRTDANITLYNSSCSTLNVQSSTILVGIANTSGRVYRADLYYNFSGELYYVRSKIVSFDQGQDWGVWGLVIVALLTMILAFMFKESLPLAIVVSTLPMVAGSLTGIILIPVWVSLGILVIAIILAIIISRYAQ